MKVLITGGAGFLGSILGWLSLEATYATCPSYGLCYEVSIASIIWQHESVCPNRSSIL